ncbi:MAG: SRPBCC family protein [Chloroflexaceae bacterium]|nr:SRPBCC family protein [Chloroflexaceae bacterium]
MSTIYTAASTQIAAAPERIYAVLTDYQHGHPQILPRQFFPSLTVETGGQGDGTIFRVRTRALGQEREYRMVVEERRPGRVLVEHDPATGVVTTFTLTPLADGNGTEVEIATRLPASAGFAGMIEHLITPPVMRHIYRAELRQLAAYLGSA